MENPDVVDLEHLRKNAAIHALRSAPVTTDCKVQYHVEGLVKGLGCGIAATVFRESIIDDVVDREIDGFVGPVHLVAMKSAASVSDARAPTPPSAAIMIVARALSDLIVSSGSGEKGSKSEV